MDDSLVLETPNILNNNLEGDEIDPLDAYMLEIDQQVQKLDESDKLKVEEEQVKMSLDSPKADVEAEEEDGEEDETIGKAGNFSTVEELIAYENKLILKRVSNLFVVLFRRNQIRRRIFYKLIMKPLII
jgi:negative regulator of genetic competence, sporulation and motility